MPTLTVKSTDLTTYQEILCLWDWLRLPRHLWYEDALKFIGDHHYEGLTVADAFIKANCNAETLQKSEHTFMLDIVRKQFYIHGSNYDDEYGRGDYNTKSTSFKWEEVEGFLLEYFSTIVAARIRKSVQAAILAKAEERIDERVNVKLNQIKNGKKVKL